MGNHRSLRPLRVFFLFLFLVSLHPLVAGGIQNTESVASKEAALTIKMIKEKVKEAKKVIKEYKKVLKKKEKLTKERLRSIRKVRVMSGVAYIDDKYSFMLTKRIISIEELSDIINNTKK